MTDPIITADDDNNLKQKIYQVVANTLKVEAKNLTPEHHFVNDLGADSLEQVELVMAFEEEFACEILDQDASKMATISDVINYVKANKSKCSNI